MDKKPTYAELERQLKELSYQLHQADIQIKNERYKSQTTNTRLTLATQVKNTFLTNMSHEIRTPLNGVIAASDLALSENPGEKVEHYLKIIHSSGTALLGLVNEILDFSKLDGGDLKLEPVAFRLDELLDSLMEMFVNNSLKKSIELLLDIEPDIPKALIGDACRLKQILTNLLDNAIKYSEKGGVICVGINKVEISYSYVVYQFYIKDSGQGIDQKYLDTVFNPFTQVDPTISRQHEGAGLGLHIAQKLVEIMNGEIGVRSEPGKGSEFFFTLRFDRQAPEKENKHIFPTDLEGLNVLIVDDCLDSIAVVKKILDSFGFQSESVTSGYDALERLRQMSAEEFYDVVIMDWKMDDLNGIEVSRIIRNKLRLSIPIIMLTAVGKESEKLDAEKLGLEAFLRKPIDAPSLFNTIIDVIGKNALENERQKKHIATKASIYKKRLPGIRVLVAEDNPTNQDITLAVLEQAGILVDIVNDGLEAVAAVKKKTFDAVLMDVQMPKMDGLEATRIIRQELKNDALPIIAMTAHALKGDEAECRKAGMNAYITKPINQDALFYALWKKVKFKEKEMETLEPQIPVAPKVTREVDLPDMLPGINIKKALRALSIEKPVFKRILLGFMKNHQDYHELLESAYQKADWDSLQSLAHSLKGSSANIGAEELQQAAYSVETACREMTVGHVPEKELLKNLQKHLDQTINSIGLIDEAAHGPSSPSGSDKINREQLTSAMIELKQAIQNADPDRVNRYYNALITQLDTSAVRDIKTNIDMYDYDEALESLKSAAQNQNIQL